MQEDTLVDKQDESNLEILKKKNKDANIVGFGGEKIWKAAKYIVNYFLGLSVIELMGFYFVIFTLIIFYCIMEINYR